MRRTQQKVREEYKDSTTNHIQGVIHAHGSLMPDEFCVVPKGMTIRPTAPSNCISYNNIFNEKVTDYRSASKRKQLTFPTSTGNYEAIYPEGSIIPNQVLNMNSEYYDKVNEGELTMRLSRLENEPQISEQVKMRQISTIKYQLSIVKSFPIEVGYTGIISGDMHEDDETTPLLQRFYNTPELVRIYDKVFYDRQILTDEEDLQLAVRLREIRAESAKFHKDMGITLGSRVLLSHILSKLKSSSPSTWILFTCRKGTIRSNSETCVRLGVDLLHNTNARVAANSLLKRAPSYDVDNEFFNFFELLTMLIENIHTISVRLLQNDPNLKWPVERDMEDAPLSLQTATRYVDDFLQNLKFQVEDGCHIRYSEFCLFKYFHMLLQHQSNIPQLSGAELEFYLTLRSSDMSDNTKSSPGPIRRRFARKTVSTNSQSPRQGSSGTDRPVMLARRTGPRTLL